MCLTRKMNFWAMSPNIYMNSELSIKRKIT